MSAPHARPTAPARPSRLAGIRPVVAGALRQARIELRIQLTGWTALSWLFFPLIGLVVMWFLRDSEIMASEVTLAQLGVAGILTMYLLTSGLMGIAGQLVMAREDGTLLRAKAVPHGVSARLLGDVVTYIGVSLVPALVLLVGASLLFDGVTPPTGGRWLWLAVVCLLGLMATLPIGAVLGSLIKSPTMLGWLSLIIYGSLAIAGIFYPITALPGWLQWVGQLLPTYWFGLGVRSAMLPDAAAALEIAHSWRTGLTVTVLLGWALVGLLLAPKALSRMARRQSGSAVAAARDRVMSKGY